MKSRKFQGFMLAQILGFICLVLLSFRLLPVDLAALGQFYLAFNGVVSAGFFGFRFGEQWARAKNGVKNDK